MSGAALDHTETDDGPRTAGQRYRAVLAEPGSGLLLAFAVLARLPLGMAPLAILLFVEARTGSFATAGLSVGVYGIANAAVSPIQGTLVDRVGQRSVLLAAAVGYAGAIAGFVVATETGAPGWVGLMAIAAAGALVPPVSACLRALWPQIVPRAGLDSAYALDAISQELIWTFGPLLVAAAVALVSPGAAVLLCGAIGLSGTIAFATRPLTRHHGSATRRIAPVARSALSSPGLRIVIATMLLFGLMTGGIEVVLPALARDVGTPSAAGVLLALWSIGSLVVGIAYGGVRWRRGSMGRRYRVLMLAVAVAVVPIAFAESLPLALAAAFIAGAPNAPALACQFALTGKLAPAGRTTEAFTWNQAAIAAGVAGGATLGGALVEAHGLDSAVWVAFGLGAFGAAIGFAGRRATDRPD